MPPKLPKRIPLADVLARMAKKPKGPFTPNPQLLDMPVPTSMLASHDSKRNKPGNRPSL